MRRLLQQGKRQAGLQSSSFVAYHRSPSPTFNLCGPPSFLALGDGLGHRRGIMMEKSKQGHLYGNNNKPQQRTSLSPYEILATKLGRFDRNMQALQVDAKGEVTTRTTSIKELLLNTEMHVRDLIALSPDALHKRGGRLTPVILPRNDVIIFVMHPLRLVISKDNCLAFDPQDPTVQSVIADIASAIKIQHLQQTHLAKTEGAALSAIGAYEVSYELVVVEQALRSFCNQFSRIKELLTLIVETSLKELVDSQGSDQEEQLFKLVPLKDGLAVAYSNMQETVDVIQDLVNSEEDMLAMLLSEKAMMGKNQIQCLDPTLHSEVELLLENYLRQLSLTGQQIKILQARVQSAQEVFAINVDLMRNRVLRITLLLTVVSTSLASAATMGAFFGMNVKLPGSLDTNPEAFMYITIGALGLGAGLFALATAFARGHGKDRMRQDLQSVAAYQSIFKHIRSVSQAIYQTSVDPTDVNMSDTKEFRAHFKKLLTDYRHYDVSWQEVDVLLEVIRTSAEQLRQQKLYSDETSEEKIYRKLFESLVAQDIENSGANIGGKGGPHAAGGTAAGGPTSPPSHSSPLP
eukprot:evm.model.NODE_14694_length_7698_cov_13.089114.3